MFFSLSESSMLSSYTITECVWCLFRLCNGKGLFVLQHQMLGKQS